MGGARRTCPVALLLRLSLYQPIYTVLELDRAEHVQAAAICLELLLQGSDRKLARELCGECRIAMLEALKMSEREDSQVPIMCSDDGHVPRATGEERHLTDDVANTTLSAHDLVPDDRYQRALEDHPEKCCGLTLEEHRLARPEMDHSELTGEDNELLEVEVGKIATCRQHLDRLVLGHVRHGSLDVPCSHSRVRSPSLALVTRRSRARAALTGRRPESLHATSRGTGAGTGTGTGTGPGTVPQVA